MKNVINDYRARKEERKRHYFEAQGLAFEEKVDKREEFRTWLEQKEHLVKRISRWHVIAALAPAAVLFFLPSSFFFETSPFSVYLLALTWGVVLRSHYLDDWDYQEFKKWRREYERKYGTYRP